VYIVFSVLPQAAIICYDPPLTFGIIFSAQYSFCHPTAGRRLNQPRFTGSLMMAFAILLHFINQHFTEVTMTVIILHDWWQYHNYNCNNNTHWCSIWKLRWPVNQSLNHDFSTLHVAFN